MIRAVAGSILFLSLGLLAPHRRAIGYATTIIYARRSPTPALVHHATTSARDAERRAPTSHVYGHVEWLVA